VFSHLSTPFIKYPSSINNGFVRIANSISPFSFQINDIAVIDKNPNHCQAIKSNPKAPVSGFTSIRKGEA
jgi:hypothetical protein